MTADEMRLEKSALRPFRKNGTQCHRPHCGWRAEGGGAWGSEARKSRQCHTQATSALQERRRWRRDEARESAGALRRAEDAQSSVVATGERHRLDSFLW